MSKESVEKKITFEEGGLEGPVMPPADNLDVINADNPPGTPEEFIGDNFDVLANIYKILNSNQSEIRDRMKIVYDKNEEKETATVFLDDVQYYFTDSDKEITNFHSWQNNKKKRTHKNTKLN